MSFPGRRRRCARSRTPARNAKPKTTTKAAAKTAKPLKQTVLPFAGAPPARESVLPFDCRADSSPTAQPKNRQDRRNYLTARGFSHYGYPDAADLFRFEVGDVGFLAGTAAAVTLNDSFLKEYVSILQEIEGAGEDDGEAEGEANDGTDVDGLYEVTFEDPFKEKAHEFVAGSKLSTRQYAINIPRR